jgi:hypothetical protein
MKQVEQEGNNKVWEELMTCGVKKVAAATN